MSMKNVLSLLEQIDGKKEKVLNIALSYCKSDCELFHEVEGYVYVKGGKAVEFKNMDEFDRLRIRVAKIEAASKVIEDMFLINEDMNKVRIYIEQGYLIPLKQNLNENDSIYDEAKNFVAQAHNYVFIASDDKIFLNERFEFFRINNIIEKAGEDMPSDEDVAKINNELRKLKGFIEDGRAVHLNKLDEEFEFVDYICDMLFDFDKSLYKPMEFPKTEYVKDFLFRETAYDKRARVFYKLVTKDIPAFLDIIRISCEKIQTDLSVRIDTEKENLNKEMEKEIFEVETAYLKNKSVLPIFSISKGDAGPNVMTNALRKQRIKEIREKYADLLVELPKKTEIIVERDKEKVLHNLKLINSFHSFLEENISGFKFGSKIKE